MTDKNTTGIYIHIPFCDGKCPYCDFYSRSADEQQKDDYLSAVIRAIKTYPTPLLVNTIYFGGGTPSVWGSARLNLALQALKEQFTITDDCETTLEANPCSVNSPMLESLVASGFNRISFGVQSTDNATLKVLGRRHNWGMAQEAIYRAHLAGFSHISADIMVGVPSQTLEGVKTDVINLTSMPIDHLSAYILKIEPNTAFAKLYPMEDQDFLADCYEELLASCEELGFNQYEISNFSKDIPSQSQHNLKYWNCEDYLGIGASAHSKIGKRRFYFPLDTTSFINAQNPWQLICEDGAAEGEDERIMLGLRLNSGIDINEWKNKEHYLKNAAPLEKLGLIRINGTTLALTQKGFLLSNTIIGKIIFD